MDIALGDGVKHKKPFFKTYFKLANTLDEYQDFIQKNPAVPALDLDYLQNNKTILLYHKGQMIGGFVYALNRPLRTLEIIKSAEIRQACYQQFEGLKVAEITGLWLDKPYRKSRFSKMLWLSIAFKAFFGEADYYLFVSKSKGLIRAMNYPACTYQFLKCEERLPGNESAEGSFFLAEKKNTFIGMLQGLVYFMFKPIHKPRKKHGLSAFKIAL